MMLTDLTWSAKAGAWGETTMGTLPRAYGYDMDSSDTNMPRGPEDAAEEVAAGLRRRAGRCVDGAFTLGGSF